MKKIWFGIGAAVIAILLLLQTKFNIYLIMDKSGYAIEEDTVKQLLLVSPEDEISQTEAPYYSFAAMDTIFKRGNSFYMGEKEKTKVDLDFPMLINGGAGIQFLDGEGILFDKEFTEWDTYQGLMINDKLSYNMGGEQADATEFLFCQLKNGLYINTDSFTYDDDGELREVARNSAICFREGYFTYCEPESGIAKFQMSRNMADEDIVTVDGEEYTYHELLLLLHVITDSKEQVKKEAEVTPTPEIIPENVENEEQIVEEEKIQPEDNIEEAKEKTEKEKEKPAAKQPSSVSPKTPTGGKGSSTASPQKGQAGGSVGVRPDKLRPDKVVKPAVTPVVDYVKPTVELNGIETGVYRIMTDLTVTDTARRLHPLRKVQLEFYEQLADNKEQLVYRNFTSKTGVITSGSGAIKPATTYRVAIYFTYLDEYNNAVTESVTGDAMVTTKDMEGLGKVSIKKGIDAETGIDYSSIPYYYDNMLTLCNVAYDKDNSDEEAVYGIGSNGGFCINIDGVTDTSFHTTVDISSGELGSFKNGKITDMSSNPNLPPKSQYHYTIALKDYFGNDIEIDTTNGGNEGDFFTCKSRPQASLELVKNEIGKVSIKAEATDPDESAIKALLPDGTDNYDFYYVISTKRNTEKNPVTLEECKAYIDNGNQRVEDSNIHFVYRFADAEGGSSSEYLDSNGAININKLIETKDLDLDTNYYVYLFCDYDLNNNREAVRFGQIAEMSFTSAALSSLGNIFIKVDIPKESITDHGVNIFYTLNERNTNDKLEELLSSIKFDIVASGGAEPSVDSSITFDDNAMKTLTGWYTENGVKVHNVDADGKPILGSVSMDERYFNASLGGSPLKSMTEYDIVPDVYATYNGKQYKMNVTLSQSKFKTMKQTPIVDLQNVLLAGDKLRFRVKISDPDETIIGNSGKYVVMNLYDYYNNFIKAVRIEKNTSDYLNFELSGVDSSTKYIMSFYATEYNNGYDNSTFHSNYLLYEYKVDSSINITGFIKLDSIVLDALDAGKLRANTNVVINDNDRVLDETLPYFVSVERDGTDVTSEYDSADTKVIDYTYGDTSATRNQIKKDHVYPVTKGEHTYVLTLYVYLNNNKVVLDTLTFTSESVVQSISSEVDLIQKIKENTNEDGICEGKFCVTDNLDLGNPETEFEVEIKGNTTKVTPVSLANILNAQIDFQGYSLTFDKTTRSGAIFNNIGPKGEISNAVINFSMNVNTYVYDTGVLARHNYGHIHDIIMYYKGGTKQRNYNFGLLCRSNAVTGIIERFVIKNDPEEGKYPFCAQQQAGMVTYANEGIVRNGYVYGEDIYTDVVEPSLGNRIYVGGLIGCQTDRGQTSNVYSLVNVLVANKGANASKIANSDYGSVIGYAYGRVDNAYGIGQSLYAQVLEDGATYDVDSIGPVLGENNAKHNRVYYWTESGVTYEKATYQKKMGLESLYDFSWQQNLLGSQFTTQPVEVGYYPHVIMSEELPEQEYIKLPQREDVSKIEILSTEVISYADDGKSAIVEFHLNNTSNALITDILIDNLTTVIDPESITYSEGTTTLRATVSEPKKFVSSYEIKQLTYNAKGVISTIEFNPKPVILIDFYRYISTPDEWYSFVVKQPTENARLANDIDFDGVDSSRIRVTAKYTGKLDGGSKDGKSYGYSLQNIDFTNTPYDYVFDTVDTVGEITNVCVENLKLGNKSIKSGSYNGFVAFLKGCIRNVHIKDVTLETHSFVGSLVSYCYPGSQVQDCSATNVTINYAEPENTNTNGYIGGLIGYGESMRINNCYVRNIKMSAEDLKNCEGAGGIIGRSASSVVNSVYATGDMVVRGNNVGGLIGRHTSSETINCLTNSISRVNVTSYQDKVGGMIGEDYLSTVLTDTNNISGVAFGNVFCTNTDAENVSFTTGSMAGYNGFYHGTDFQLMNGMSGVECDKNTYKDENGSASGDGLLSYEQVTNPSIYTDSNFINMQPVYNFEKVREGYIPRLYYMDTTIELPFQEDEPISLSKVMNNLIEVRDVFVSKDQNRISMDLKGPAGYEITGFTIKDLNCMPLEKGQIFSENGNLRLVINYKPRQEDQEHFLDSYQLLELTYKYGTQVVGKSDYRNDPVRVPLTLFFDIKDIPTWNTCMSEEHNSGNYENYRIIETIDFSSGADYRKNTKIGRLVGMPQAGGQKLTLQNITITDNKTNLIFRLNSELSNLNFKNCTVTSSGRPGVGLIGTSAAIVSDVNFENIKIDNKGAGYEYVGIIGCQVGGKLGMITDPDDMGLGKVTLKNVSVGLIGQSSNYVGGLTGFALGGTILENIDAENVNVKGYSQVGGIVGRTNKASFNEVHGKDFKVTSLGGSYTGGILGLGSTGYSALNSASFTNVTLTGTPTYDGEGNIIDSTTVIAVDEAKAGAGSTRIGGLIGHMEAYAVGFKSNGTIAADASPNMAEGIIVKGYANYVGGLYGLSYCITNSTLKDSLVTLTKTPTTMYNGAGGVSGYQYYYNRYNNCINSTVNVQNFSNVGLITGEQVYHNVYYDSVENSHLIAKNPGNFKISNFGGLIGKSTAPVYQSGVINSTVDASSTGMTNTGGITGRNSSTVERCFVYGEPNSDTEAVAKPEYIVKGYDYSGAITGDHTAGTVARSYSNINVESTNNYAGGVIGYYHNEYTTNTINGKTVNSYSYVFCVDNYFAGSVKAHDYAGGVIGCLGMAEGTSVTDSDKASGGRRATKDSNTQLMSGAGNENQYTYRNLVLASKVTATQNAYAFCGNLDGFEGKANIVTASADNSSADKAYRTFFWEGMQLNDTPMYRIENTDNTPDMAKNSGTYRYKRWNYNGGEYKSLYSISDTDSTRQCNVRIVTSEDLSLHDSDSSTAGIQDMYFSICMHRYNGSEWDYDIRGDYFLLPLKDVTNYSTFSPYNIIYNDGNAYLPLIRSTNGGNGALDFMTQYQANGRMPAVISIMGGVGSPVKIPVPQWNRGTLRAMFTVNFNSYDDTYGTIYTSDVDKINVEFSEDLVDYGYFMLTYGDTVVDKQLITKRVYSYAYDYKKGLKLSYGYADPEYFKYNMDQDGKVQGVDYEMEDIFGYPEYFWEVTEEPIYYNEASLRHHIMTYRDKYYYISEDGLVSGTGSGVTDNEDDKEEDTSLFGSSKTIEDQTAQTMEGSYINIYDGKALNESGEVIDVTSGNVVRNITEGIIPLDNALPMQTFAVLNYSVETYSRFSEIISNTLVSRPQQILKNLNGEVDIIDGKIENVKDAVVLYLKDEKSYCTVLGNDGIVVDMHQGSDIGAPEDFKSSGIVYMTNNFKTSAPFILVEYANGGIVGYNYMTGEYLFNHSVSNVMDLLSFAKVYFAGDKSELSNISASYASVSKVAEIAGTPERLMEMVAGTNSGLKVTDNSNGNGITEDEESEKVLAKDDGLKATDETAVRNYDTDGMKKEMTVTTDENPAATTQKAESTGIVHDSESPVGVTEKADTSDKDDLTEGANKVSISAQGANLEGEGVGLGEQTTPSIGTTMANGDQAAELGGDKKTTEDDKVDLSDESNQLLEEQEDEDKAADSVDEAAYPTDSKAKSDKKIAEQQQETTSENETMVDENGTTGILSRAEDEVATSTAGTVIGEADEQSQSNILMGGKQNNTIEDVEKSDSSETNEVNLDTAKAKELMTVYNQSTGTFEILDMEQYLSSGTYQSENVKLAVRDLSVYSGYAEKNEKKENHGLLLYILVSLALLSGIGLTIRYRKQHKMKF